MVKHQITRAKEVLEFYNNNVMKEFSFKEIDEAEIRIVVPDLCDKKDGCISYHEPHCSNYFLLEDEASPFIQPDVDDVDKEQSSSNFSSRASRASRRSSIASQ